MLRGVQHVTLIKLHRSHIIGSSKSLDLHSSVPPHWTYLTQSNHIDAVIHVLGYLRYHSYPCDTDDCKSSLTPHQATDPNLAATGNEVLLRGTRIPVSPYQKLKTHTGVTQSRARLLLFGLRPCFSINYNSNVEARNHMVFNSDDHDQPRVPTLIIHFPETASVR